MPRWSDDGRLIAFVCETPESDEICIISPQGFGLRRLTVNDVPDSDPAWRPSP